MGGSLLSVNNLSFSYGEREIFRDISFSVEAGEVVCILGQNGCGKTTLLDCILGTLSCGTGDVLLQGQSLETLSCRETALMAAYVPQSHEKHFPFTVMDILLMGRTAHTSMFNRPGKRDRLLAKELLTQVGMAALADRDYTELSGGETQLILILRALIQESPMIVMDEPTCHLDYKNELILLERVEFLAKELSRGVIMTTHSPNQALFLENRGVRVKALLMRSGRIDVAGSPSEVLNPENMAELYGIRTLQISGGEPTVSTLVPMEIIKE